eukprot:CAMPEP_0178869538 /NCGR_PEP_ID=MMETSP0747-20121128/6595_1 /TAXON_ID=913974 /ORGANISM="Nitzschia punctata, Strain CCMP561" /LENGTH=124 /DNA_ID=CAMNT_0020536595 /DNA_START=331 /DNA_END=705 /DNA_ORIENTATION=-
MTPMEEVAIPDCATSCSIISTTTAASIRLHQEFEPKKLSIDMDVSLPCTARNIIGQSLGLAESFSGYAFTVNDSRRRRAESQRSAAAEPLPFSFHGALKFVKVKKLTRHKQERRMATITQIQKD